MINTQHPGVGKGEEDEEDRYQRHIEGLYCTLHQATTHWTEDCVAIRKRVADMVKIRQLQEHWPSRRGLKGVRRIGATIEEAIVPGRCDKGNIVGTTKIGYPWDIIETNHLRGATEKGHLPGLTGRCRPQEKAGTRSPSWKYEQLQEAYLEDAHLHLVGRRTLGRLGMKRYSWRMSP